MERPPETPPPPLPDGAEIRRRPDCGVAEFRQLYDAVGSRHLWWLRRTLSDSELAAHLAKPGVRVHVLYRDGKPAGFHELERLDPTIVNLNYFGLFPDLVGHGFGRAFLRHAIDVAWGWRPRTLTVNTCTADHKRALPTYLAAGFVPVRSVDEVWEVPTRLGLSIPPGLGPP